MQTTFHRTVLALIFLSATIAYAQDEKPKIVTPLTIMDPLTPAEEAFSKLLTGATLAGKFGMDLQPDGVPRSERYVIEAVRKVKDDHWIVQSRMKVGDAELPIPVPVQVRWAGDTPVLQLTDLNIPLVGEGFTVRILFYGNHYAGTWQHGKIGGHMWGIIERPAEGQATPSDSSGKKPDVTPEKDSGLQ